MGLAPFAAATSTTTTTTSTGPTTTLYPHASLSTALTQLTGIMTNAVGTMIPIVLGIAGAGITLLVAIVGVRWVYSIILRRGMPEPEDFDGSLGDIDVDDDYVWEGVNEGVVSVGDWDGPEEDFS